MVNRMRITTLDRGEAKALDGNVAMRAQSVTKVSTSSFLRETTAVWRFRCISLHTRLVGICSHNDRRTVAQAQKPLMSSARSISLESINLVQNTERTNLSLFAHISDQFSAFLVHTSTLRTTRAAH